MISLIAFVLVAFAMFGIEKKRSYGQALMFVSQIFRLLSKEYVDPNSENDAEDEELAE